MTQRTQSLGPAQSTASVSLFLLDSHHPPALACVSFHRELKHIRLGALGSAGSWLAMRAISAPSAPGGKVWLGKACGSLRRLLSEASEGPPERCPGRGDMEAAPETLAMRIRRPDSWSHSDCQQPTAKAPTSHVVTFLD